MVERKPSNMRNVAFVGHGGTGKTTLVDHLLHRAGCVNRAGSVDDGSSRSDYDQEEKERKFSIDSTFFHFDWQGKIFNIIDTPGYLDFSGAAIGVLPAVETALITVSASEGIQLNTRRMWQAAGEQGLARVVVLTQLDHENIQFDDVLQSLQEALSSNCVPLMLPIGLGERCSGVVSLLEAEQAPDGVVGDVQTLRERAREAIIESDEGLLNRYFEGEEISAGELQQALKSAMVAGQVTPVLCSAAKKNIGVEELLRFIAECAPSPQEGVVRTAVGAAGEEVALRGDLEQPFCAMVIKTAWDVHTGKQLVFRVYGGTLGEDGSVLIPRTGETERLTHLNCLFGQEHKEVESAAPGDILAVTKVEAIIAGDTLCEPGAELRMESPSLPKPMMSLAVEPHSRDDEQKIGMGLQRLAEADPTLRIERDRRSRELVVTGMGSLHLDVMLSRLKRRYGVSADTHTPSVPYEETITKKAEGRYRHKKQTGGRGQYGEVYLRVEPNERGAGFEYIDEVKGGAIPQQYMPAIEKGIREVLEQGLLAGCPIVDLKATVYYGTYHSVDSSEAAFKIAGARAFQDAFEKSAPVLLEPIAKIEVTVAAQYMGDITSNLTGHRGRILGMKQVGQMQVIEAEIPVAEVQRYSTELNSMTGGEGSFTMEFSHYEPAPADVQRQVVARKKAEKEKG